MSEIFRKSSLEKISSPEQLDKMIVITPPSFWISMIGAGVIIAAALIWSVWGRLPENVEAQGIYVNRDGMQSVYAEGSGIVDEILVSDGDVVSKGDVLVRLNTESIEEKIAEYEEKKAAVENVSVDTVADIKNISNNDEILSMYQELYQNMNLLKHQTEQLEKKKTELAASEKKYLALEAEYYNSMNIGDSTDEQLAFQEAQSEYSSANSYLENARGSEGQAEIQYDSVLAAYKAIEEKYQEDILKPRKTLEDAVKTAQTALEEALEAAGYVGGITEDNLNSFAAQAPALVDAYKTAKNTLDTYNGNVAAAEASYKDQLKQQQLSVDSAKDAWNLAEDAVKKYEKQKKSASADYESAKSDYIHRVEAIGAAQAYQSELGNRYNVAANLYNTDKNAVQSLEDSVAQAKIQINVTKTYILSNLKNEYKQYLDQKEVSEIKATIDGKISELAVSEGDIVGQGNEVAKIQKGEDSDKIIVCYVPVANGRKIQDGMKVLIYPSTVNRQEYGHMEATVLSVDEYVTSTTDMVRQLGDQNLVEAFMQSGPVVEVVCELRESADTASGYYWSSNKGASIMIDGGTMVEASVVVSEKPPISLLIPFLKEKLTIKADE